MSSFEERLGIVPLPAWITGVVLAALVTLPLALGPMRFDHEMSQWPVIAKVGMLALPPVFIIAYAGLIGFIYADAKRRRMRHVLWAWLALVPYFIGVILYFILRDPMPTQCPHCGAAVPRNHAYCQGCGASVHPTCPKCGKSVDLEWQNCPQCGTRIAPAHTAVIP